jgi:hypothetical protein
MQQISHQRFCEKIHFLDCDHPLRRLLQIGCGFYSYAERSAWLGRGARCQGWVSKPSSPKHGLSTLVVS